MRANIPFQHIPQFSPSPEQNKATGHHDSWLPVYPLRLSSHLHKQIEINIPPPLKCDLYCLHLMEQYVVQIFLDSSRSHIPGPCLHCDLVHITGE